VIRSVMENIIDESPVLPRQPAGLDRLTAWLTTALAHGAERCSPSRFIWNAERDFLRQYFYGPSLCDLRSVGFEPSEYA